MPGHTALPRALTHTRSSPQHAPHHAVTLRSRFHLFAAHTPPLPCGCDPDALRLDNCPHVYTRLRGYTYVTDYHAPHPCAYRTPPCERHGPYRFARCSWFPRLIPRGYVLVYVPHTVGCGWTLRGYNAFARWTLRTVTGRQVYTSYSYTAHPTFTRDTALRTRTTRLVLPFCDALLRLPRGALDLRAVGCNADYTRAVGFALPTPSRTFTGRGLICSHLVYERDTLHGLLVCYGYWWLPH